MTVKNDTGKKTFEAGEDLEPYRRVKLSAQDTVMYADAAEASIGVTTSRALSGALVSVDLWTKAGTFEIEASEAIAVAAEVYGAADGKVKATASGSGLGWANEVSSGTTGGGIIEVVKMQTAEA